MGKKKQKKLTEAGFIATITKRWAARITHDARRGGWYDRDKDGEIYEKLLALKAVPTRENVEKIFGNYALNWIALACDICGQRTHEVSVYGEGTVLETFICDECVARMKLPT